MATSKALMALCVPDDEARSALIAHQQTTLSQWDNWLQPLSTGDGAGDDPAYDDDFQLMREEINKLSGTDTELLCRLAENILCSSARDIRVVTWYSFARLQRDGEQGLCEGLQLLVALLTRYGEHCHPRRPNARKSALEWLNSTKIQDTLARWPDATREQTSQTAAILCLLESLLERWPEIDRPMLDGLSRALELRLAGSGGLDGLTPQASTAESAPSATVRASAPGSAVKSEGEFLSQSKVLASWLADQQDGWLASHRLMKAVRWDTVGQLPALDASGRTRLSPPKPEYRAQLKRLYLQQNWTELVEQASDMFCEGGNRFWLDLQWYLWQGLTRAGHPWNGWAGYITSDLKLLLARLHGLEQLSWSDGTPFADEVTLSWIAEKVNDDMPGLGDESAVVVGGGGQTDDILALESEAMTKGDSDGPEAALSWLQTRPGIDSLRSRWLQRLLMARVAEQYGRNEMALHLLGELITGAPRLTLNDWEPALLFEVQARRLKLLRLKAGRSETDKARLAPEMDVLLAGLIAIDPARAMVLCG